MKPFWRVFLLLILTMSAGTAFSQGNFFLLCRGPLIHATGTGGNTSVVFFAKNTTSSGSGGISLQPGKCAWTDRPVSATEPTKIYWFTEPSSNLRASFVAFTSCAGDSKCVVEFLAHNANNTGDPHFRIDDGYIRIRPAAFP